MPFICSYFDCNTLFICILLRKPFQKLSKHFILTRSLKTDNIADIVHTDVIAALCVRTYAFFTLPVIRASLHAKGNKSLSFFMHARV